VVEGPATEAYVEALGEGAAVEQAGVAGRAGRGGFSPAGAGMDGQDGADGPILVVP
jgi:hypothetical protein